MPQYSRNIPLPDFIENSVVVSKGSSLSNTIQGGIAAAVTLNPSITNPITVLIHPGVYTEDNPIVIPAFIHLKSYGGVDSVTITDDSETFGERHAREVQNRARPNLCRPAGVGRINGGLEGERNSQRTRARDHGTEASQAKGQTKMTIPPKSTIEQLSRRQWRPAVPEYRPSAIRQRRRTTSLRGQLTLPGMDSTEDAIPKKNATVRWESIR